MAKRRGDEKLEITSIMLAPSEVEVMDKLALARGVSRSMIAREYIQAGIKRDSARDVRTEKKS